MSKVKEAIEAMIEESYLLGLSEDEIRQDFKRFIDTCYHVLQANVKDRGVISQLTESLAREQTCILIADREENATELVELETGSEPVPKDAREAFAEKAARRKRQILRTIASYDPSLVRLIDAQRFQGDSEEPDGSNLKKSIFAVNWFNNGDNWRLKLLKIGYASTILIIILIIYLGFIQQ
jgi:hypothetical protein